MKNDLKELIEKSNLSLVDISKRTGISVSTIYRYANGKIKNIKSDYYNMIVDTIHDQHNITEAQIDSLKKSMAENSLKPHNHETILNSINNSNDLHNNINIDNNTNHTSVINTNINTNKYFKRGDIYYVKNNNATGSEVWGSRLAVIVSSNKLNQIMGTVEVVYVTSQPKNDLPCHCTIKTERALSVVLCEQIHSVSKSRLGNYMGTVTDIEMQVIEKALRVSLDLKLPPIKEELSADYIMLQTERNFYKNFYEHVMKVWMVKSTREL